MQLAIGGKPSSVVSHPRHNLLTGGDKETAAVSQ